MKNQKIINLGGCLVVAVVAVIGAQLLNISKDYSKTSSTATVWKTPISNKSAPELTYDDVQKIALAFKRQQHGVLVQAQGVVEKLLSDDNKGSRHQRFILRLSNGQKLLLAHNIDLAPRIQNLKKGDIVAFKGSYEYNPQGGVIHWTHHDPQGLHADGWLMHEGRSYQ